MNVQKSAEAALYSRGESRVSGDMLPKWEYSRQYDPRYGHGISQAEGAVKLGQNMPTLREAYPLAADFEFSEEFYRKNGRLLIDAEPFITRTHTAFSNLPLGDSIETYHGKKFIVDRSNGSIEWYFPLTDGFLADKDVKLTDSGKLFVVENNYEVKEIGKNAYMTEIKNPPKDLKVDDAPPRDFAAIAKLSILFGLDGARLA
ncbi:MAG: hypothetical protein NT051_04910, partial [Candidatus Micrarchaeota archaeon]|nr:hypothetical protein [Candidatus Micrarchaeota archaeon]